MDTKKGIMKIENKYCLLIGNSRWHWAEQRHSGWNFFHTAPDPQKLLKVNSSLVKWAAVGVNPSNIKLNPITEIKINPPMR